MCMNIRKAVDEFSKTYLIMHKWRKTVALSVEEFKAKKH